MNARLVSSTSPSGTMPTNAATAPVTAACQFLLSLVWNWLQSSSGATTSITSEIQRSSWVVPATSSEWAVLGCLASAASRVGVGLGADRRRLELPVTGDHDRSGAHLVAGRLGDGLRLAGEQRLVDLQTVSAGDDPVSDDLITGLQLDQVIERRRRRSRSPP